MDAKQTVEVAITPARIVTITGDVRDLFTIIRALKEEGHDPQVRYEDEEVGTTCWQPTRRAA